MTIAGNSGDLTDVRAVPPPREEPDPTGSAADPERLATGPRHLAGATPARGDGLGAKTARGALVTLAGQFSQILLQLTSVVVLSRILSPHDYGLYTMVLVMVGIGEIFRDFGLSSAAIQAVTLTRGQRDNLFWVNTAMGAGLTAIAFVIAPELAALFGQHQLVSIARILSFTFLVNGLATQFRADLNRRMRFGLLAVTDLTALATSVGVAIVFAVGGAGYWALVASQLAQVLTILLLVIVFTRWRPGLPRRGQDMSRFLRFGGHFVATQIVYYASNNLDSLTIGLRFGPTPLGVYNRAFQLLMNPLNQFRAPATTVALPVLSRLQHDLQRSSDYIKRGQIAIGYTIVAGLALAAGAATPLVHLFLGTKWSQVAPVFAFLAIAGIFQMLSYVGYWAYLSRGLTAELFRYTLVSFAIKAVCIGVGSTWGVVGVAAGYAVAPFLAWPLSLWWLSRKTVMPTADLYRGASRIVTMATISGLASYLICTGLRRLPDLVALALATASTVAIYALAAVVSARVRADLAGVLGIVRKVANR